MSEKLCTAGPWTFVGNSWQYTTVYSKDGTPVCQLDLEDWGVTEDNQDDLGREQTRIAQLIAVTPELYLALNDIIEYVEDFAVGADQDDPVHEMLPRWRTLLAKARGEQS